MTKDINDEISRCIIALLMREPFYAHVLSSVVRKVSSDISSAAVGYKGGQYILYINEDFFLNQLKSDSERIAVVKHEALHLVCKHLFRLKLGRFDKQLFNIAADIVVNQYIEPWELPDSAVSLRTFPKLKLPPDKSVEWYYHKLKESVSIDTELNKQIQAVANQKTHGDHSNWIDGGGFSIEVAKAQLEKLILQAKDRTSSKDYGRLPSSIRNSIDAVIRNSNSKIDWKTALNIFSTTSKRTRVYHTMKRISKRYGTRPGIRIKSFQNLVVAIDTSGSINQDTINIFFTEIHKIWKLGADIEILECDAKVQNNYAYRGVVPELISGGGGTLFDPVFAYISSNRYKRYDGCIYLTDGYAPEPIIKPPCKVLWCVTEEGKIGPHLKYGKVAQIYRY
jgi:predicted metal-dependent peptidase